jgi:N-acyl-D-aspartate/D-glutamate deacylase
MKGSVIGIIEKVLPIRQIDNRSIQEFVIVEQTGKKPKPFLIQNWGDTRKELENMGMDDRVGEKVQCDCYFNGYEYYSNKFGTQYGIRVILINIQSA